MRLDTLVVSWPAMRHSKMIMLKNNNVPDRQIVASQNASASKGVGLTLYGAAVAWISVTALAFTGGGVDAIALSTVQRYTAHMSGTTSLLAGALVNLDTRLAILSCIVILAFVMGAIGSGWIIAGAETGEPRRIASHALLLEGFLIGAGTVTLLKFNGGYANEVIVLIPLAMAMGLQNRTGVFLAGGKARTTHVTGTLTDLGYHVGHLARNRLARQANDYAAIGRMSALFCAFLAGGVVGRVAFLWIGILTLVGFASIPLVLAIVVRAAPTLKLSSEE